MSQEQTVTAVVLRRWDVGDKDRRLTLLTLEQGKIDAVAKGARKAGSRLTGMSEPLMLARLQLAKGRAVRYVTQSQPISAFPGLREDLDRLLPALSFAELLSAVVPYEQPVPEMFHLAVRALHELEGHPEPLAASVWSIARLLIEAGFAPELDACVDTGSPPVGSHWLLSPSAGGLVSATVAPGYADCFEAPREAVIGWRKTAELDAPPSHLRRAEECALAMMPFWREACGIALPATEAWMRELRLRLGDTGEASPFK
ncbi:MAG: DNA repair protein RecO [Fimbriimonadales bacterium]|nr:DNA repair protein RecO [Fimbriimonadales bacterium]